MHDAVFDVLVGLPTLSGDQVSGLITAVATMKPLLLPRLTLRPDLTDEHRLQLVEAAPDYCVVDLLELMPADPGLVEAAAGTKRALPGLIALCGARGWLGQAVELAAGVSATELDAVADRWGCVVGSDLPESLVVALVNSVLTERGRRPDLRKMSEWERHETLERLGAEEEQCEQAAWSMLENRPEIWPVLVAGPQANKVQRILLNRAAVLSDELLVACLPSVTKDLKPGDPFFQGLRLRILVEQVQRWPRLRQIAAETIAGLIGDVVSGGWVPLDQILGLRWEDIAALAGLTADGELLASVVASIRESYAISRREPGRRPAPRDDGAQAKALEELAANPSTPRDGLLALVPLLEERELEAVLRRSDGALNAACRDRLGEIHRLAEVRKPPFTSVPSDNELAAGSDPAGVLAGHLRHLRGRAAQRDITIAGLLRSRYATPDLLRALPAHNVLDSPHQVAQVAEMVAETCGRKRSSWASLAEAADRNLPRSVTFGEWLGQLHEAGRASS